MEMNTLSVTFGVYEGRNSISGLGQCHYEKLSNRRFTYNCKGFLQGNWKSPVIQIVSNLQGDLHQTSPLFISPESQSTVKLRAWLSNAIRCLHHFLQGGNHLCSDWSFSNVLKSLWTQELYVYNIRDSCHNRCNFSYWCLTTVDLRIYKLLSLTESLNCITRTKTFVNILRIQRIQLILCYW